MSSTSTLVANTDYDTIFLNDLDGLVSGNVLSNDTSNGGQPQLKFVDGDRIGAKGAAEITVEGTYGTFTFKPDGSYTYKLTDKEGAASALASGHAITETVSYKISNGSGATDFDYLKISIKPPHSAPTADDTSVSISSNQDSISGNVLDTAHSSDGSALHVSRVGGENFATATRSDYQLHFVDDATGYVAHGQYGDLLMHRDGSYEYQLNSAGLNLDHADYDKFQYRVYDGAFGEVSNANSTDVAVLTINIAPHHEVSA